MTLTVRAMALALLMALPGAASLPANAANIVAPTGTVPSGEDAVYADGTFFVVRNVTVEPGASLTFERADVLFVGGPWVITVMSGSRFDSTDSTLRPDPSGAPRDLFPGRLPGPGVVDARYQQALNTALGHPSMQSATNRSFRVDVQQGALFDLVGTTVENATGVDVFSDLTTIEDVRFVRNDVGLTLHDVDIEIDGLNFTENLVGLRVMGGEVVVRNGYFDRNEDHIVVNDSDFTLETTEVYAGLHGLDLERGSATLIANTFREHAGPDTIGVWIRDATFATLHANVISDWLQNVRIENTPTTFTSNEVTSPPSSSSTLLAIGYGAEEATEELTVAFNILRGGSASVSAAESTGELLVRNNTLSDAGMSVYGAAGEVHNNTLTGSWLSVDGAASQVHRNTLTDASIGVSGSTSHVHNNTGLRAGISASGSALVEDNEIDGAGASGWMGASDGALLRNNVVRNSDTRCFSVTRATSIENLASECREGFTIYADDSGTASSTGDRYERATYDPDAGTNAFDLVGHDATLTDAYAERAVTGIRVRPLDINDGGSTILRATIVDGGTGVDVHLDTWDAFLVDSDILRNKIGVVARARDTHIDDTRIKDSTLVGIYVTGGTALGEQNWIEDNAFGVELGDAGHATLENCYWGHAGGATDSTHPGQGDEVDDDVDWQPHLSVPPS